MELKKILENVRDNVITVEYAFKEVQNIWTEEIGCITEEIRNSPLGDDLELLEEQCPCCFELLQ